MSDPYSGAAVHQTPLIKRDVFDHDKYDIDVLQDTPDLGPMKTDVAFMRDAVLNAYVLFNTVTTIMLVVDNFKRSVSPDLRYQYGEDSFAVIFGLLTYMPLGFLLVVILLFNNFYSERTFYMYLRRCAIIDFPMSYGVGYIMTHIRSILFVLFWLVYFLFGIGVMIKFEAGVGTIFIFSNNLIVGMMLAWYRQQSIESKFISLSDFIQSFPDRNGTLGNIDETSLHRAALFVERLTLTETQEPSYTDYMRLFWWKNKQYSTATMVCHHFSVWFIIFAMSGAAVGYFIFLQGRELKATWLNTVVPCATVCRSAFLNVSYAITPPSIVLQCTTCVCRCLSQLDQLDPKVLLAGKGLDTNGFGCQAALQNMQCTAWNSTGIF